MAKKFFFEKVHNTKRTIIHLSIIGGCLIGIIICFIVVKTLTREKPKTKSELNIKSDIKIGLNEEFTNDIFFSKIEGFDINDVIVTFPNNFSRAIPGEYEVTLTIGEGKYKTNLIVMDTNKPNLILREITINQGKDYSVNDFVVSCVDDSNEQCQIDYYTHGIDEDGNSISFDNFRTVGKYPIKITAKDSSGNETIVETTLNIVNASGNTGPVTKCKYGSNEYSRGLYTPALDISTGGCGITLNYNKAGSEIEEIAERETQRLLKDLQKYNLVGDPYINRRITTIYNLTGDGIVGYELEFRYTIEYEEGFDKKEDVIAEYKIGLNGHRTFSINKYNIPIE